MTKYMKLAFIYLLLVLFVVYGTGMISKTFRSFAVTWCWGVYDTSACHARWEAEKAAAFDRDKDLR